MNLVCVCVWDDPCKIVDFDENKVLRTLSVTLILAAMSMFLQP